MDSGSKRAKISGAGLPDGRWHYIRKPSDLGFDDGGFVLPPLRVTRTLLQTDFIPEGHLFPGWSVVSRGGHASAARDY